VTISTKPITAKLVYVHRTDKNYKELSKALTKKNYILYAKRKILNELYFMDEIKS
jgi:hypothetical protein